MILFLQISWDCVKEGGKGVGCLPGSCSRLCEHLELPKKVEGLPKRKSRKGEIERGIEEAMMRMGESKRAGVSETASKS